MSNKSFCQLKGVSGTGKGTRVSQLLLFLNHVSQIKAKIVHIDNKPYAIYIEEFNLLVPGKYVVSNKSGLVSLTGLDIMASDLKDGRFIPKELIKLYPEANIICEGYVNTLVEFYQPTYQYNNGFSNQQWELYSYNNLEELQKRIIRRSASRIKCICWSCNKKFKLHFNKKILSQCSDIADKDSNFHPFTLFTKYDEFYLDFGKRWLAFNGYRHLVDEYTNWSESNSVLRSVTQPQDLSIFPTYLLDGRTKNLRDTQDITQPKVSTIEELKRIESNYHKGEPFVLHTLLLTEVEAFLRLRHNFSNYEEYRKKYNISQISNGELPRLHVLKRRLLYFSSEFGELYVELDERTKHILELIGLGHD